MRKIPVLLAIFTVLGLSTGATLEEEAKANQGSVTFYQMSLSEFDKKNSSFTQKLVEQANTYCEANLLECGLESWNGNEFKNVHLRRYNSPLEETNYLTVKYYLKYDASMNTSQVTTQHVVPKTALKAITKGGRQAIMTALGYTVVKVDGEMEDLYHPAPKHLLNSIIIPIACVTLIVVIAIAIGCRIYDNRKEKKAQEGKMQNYALSEKVDSNPKTVKF